MRACVRVRLSAAVCVDTVGQAHTFEQPELARESGPYSAPSELGIAMLVRRVALQSYIQRQRQRQKQKQKQSQVGWMDVGTGWANWSRLTPETRAGITSSRRNVSISVSPLTV